ncbi:MAG: hypothetical protein KGJ78_09700 [Alphaproteobacteria bacterium]|nr:hypothetical protein [Alphaproteobacteria bacterium]
MSAKAYLGWVLTIIALAVLALAAFNAAAEHLILDDSNGPSLQTVSGFERVLKPAWLDSIEPEIVFVGSSRMREGFDPVLVDKAFRVRSFDYGVSSITAYEARRFAEDAIAHPSVKTVVMALDAFSGTNSAQKTGPGFDDLRLKVTPEGKPTPRRALWLFTTRYLSGGAAGMHALGLYDLMQLRPGQTAADRPDLFEAYGRMTMQTMHHDLVNRNRRVFVMGRWQRGEFRTFLNDLCGRRDLRTILFFPPDNAAIIALYRKNDAAGFDAFKSAVLADVRRHNATCDGKVTLFDFMNDNAITGSPLRQGASDDYIDLVHFRPAVGVRLLRRMLGHGNADGGLGVKLTGP